MNVGEDTRTGSQATKKRLDKGQPVTGGTCDTYKPVCALHRRVVSGLLIFVMSKPIHNWPQ